MKKILALALILCLFISSASALTVSEFCEAYNADIGEGFYRLHTREEYIQNDYWFVSGADERHTIAVQFDTSAADPAQAEVICIIVRQKPRVSVSTFINNMAAALAAAYPDVSEDIRLAELVRCLRVRDNVFDLFYTDHQAVPYHSEYFGEMVYQEDGSYNTFLFRPAGGQ